MIMKSFKNNQITNLSEVDIRNKQITACNDKKSLRGKHPNSLKNLKPYPKGVSGNTLGKPHKYTNLAESLSKLSMKKVVIEKWNGVKYEKIETNKTNKNIVLETIWSKARLGDMKYIQFLAYLGCLD